MYVAALLLLGVPESLSYMIPQTYIQSTRWHSIKKTVYFFTWWYVCTHVLVRSCLRCINSLNQPCCTSKYVYINTYLVDIYHQVIKSQPINITGKNILVRCYVHTRYLVPWQLSYPSVFRRSSISGWCIGVYMMRRMMMMMKVCM